MSVIDSDQGARRVAAAPEEVWDEKALQSSQRKNLLTVMGWRAVLLVAFVGAWQATSGPVIDPFYVSTPSDIATRLWEWLRDGTVATHLYATLQATLMGFVIGGVVGIGVGFFLGRSPLVARVVDPYIIAIYSLPKVALAPLFILWFGIGMTSKVVLAATIVFFLVFYNTYAGVRAVDRDLVDVVRLMGGTRRDILRRVVLPSSATWIFNGLKISVPYALIGAVVGELTASDRGIGFVLKRASGTFDTAGVFASLVILMVVATILNQMVVYGERYVDRWRSTPT
ncbi:MAG: ABC transporter permease subunit [Propionibacteriales bacterium]|nr:ABC transporter permease subunit [Propionibacteriales bacterium]